MLPVCKPRTGGAFRHRPERGAPECLLEWLVQVLFVHRTALWVALCGSATVAVQVMH